MTRAACRQFSVVNGAIPLTTQNSLNSRMACYAPATAGIVDLVLTFPGFEFVNPEAVIPTAYTVTAAVEYPTGVFTPFTVGGSRTLSITPAEAVYSFDPLGLYIPAGQKFYIKCFAQFSAGNFPLCMLCASNLTSDWTTAGTNVTDHTLDATVLASSSPVVGFSGSVYAKFTTPQKAIGIIGDSVAYAGSDTCDPNTGARYMDRAMRGVVPAINLATAGDTAANFLQQPAGRELLLNNLVDSVICEYGRNDINGGITLATIQSRLQAIWSIFTGYGMKVWQATITPQTTSTDGWSTAAGQTVSNATAEALRLQVNAWIRTNWQALGISGFIDQAWAVDPTDSGKWSADGSSGTYAAGFCTLSAGAVTACTIPVYNGGNNGGGGGYPGSATVACTVRGYPGETGALPTITATTNGSGVVTSFNIISPGSGLLYPPMVAANGAWTGDGTHPNARGYNEIIYFSGLGPTSFS